MKTMIELFEAARRVGVPFVAVRTADQWAAEREITDAWSNATQTTTPIYRWDTAVGLQPVNDLARKSKQQFTSQATVEFHAAMTAAASLEKNSIVFAHNAWRFLASQEPMACAANVQALANLRDAFKRNHRQVVLLGPSFVAPLEMAQDVVVLDHALPTREKLATVVTQLCALAKFKPPSREDLDKATDALSGLSLFSAEQQAAMSLSEERQGLDLDMLWERKRVAIEQTKGLSVWRGGERFSDIVGADAIKAHLRSRMRSRTPVGVCVFMDEIDKVFANVEQDGSGVRMDQVRTILTDMENHEWRGCIAVGVPGAGKSLLAKAFGNECGVPTIALDLGGMENKFVGESEAAMRQAMEVIRAVGNGNAYFIATSNNATVMRPELQRRFTDGMWFFDVASPEQVGAYWSHYVAKYGLDASQELPASDGWTGAEVRNCCRYAWDTGVTLVEAARFIVPMAQSRIDDIEKLRLYAHGRFLDANTPGPYSYTSKATESLLRAIDLKGAKVQ